MHKQQASAKIEHPKYLCDHCWCPHVKLQWQGLQYLPLYVLAKFSLDQTAASLVLNKLDMDIHFLHLEFQQGEPYNWGLVSSWWLQKKFHLHFFIVSWYSNKNRHSFSEFAKDLHYYTMLCRSLHVIKNDIQCLMVDLSTMLCELGFWIILETCNLIMARLST